MMNPSKLKETRLFNGLVATIHSLDDRCVTNIKNACKVHQKRIKDRLMLSPDLDGINRSLEERNIIEINVVGESIYFVLARCPNWSDPLETVKEAIDHKGFG
jgi:hypothetical protein